MSQTDAILTYLKTGKALTPLEALSRFGCFRLAARIKELREDGHAISTDKIETPGGARVARYRLAQ